MTFDLEGQGQGQIGKKLNFRPNDDWARAKSISPTILDGEQ